MTHKEIIDGLRAKKIAILAGAGISSDSGLPTVSAFYNHFFPIFYDPEDVKSMIDIIYNNRSPIPFERMMEHIFSYTGRDYSIMNIFDNGIPNTIHHILAQMMWGGWADEIYTTNFDCLIEDAIYAKGLTTKNYDLFYDEKGFGKLHKTNCNKKVVKIHGSIREKESIRATLETITSQLQLNRRKPPIERLFSYGAHEVVIVLGYSFSDIFDVNRFIENLKPNKTIIVINHKKGENADSKVQLLSATAKLGRNKNPFYKKPCEGYIVNIDTLSFMSELCSSKYGSVPSINPTKYDWTNYLDNWGLRFDPVHKAYAAGGICNSMNEFEIGNKYITKAFQNINRDRTELFISIVNHYVLAQFRKRKNRQECDHLIALCNDAIDLLEEQRNTMSNEFYLKRLGGLKARMGRIYEDGYSDYNEAKRHYYSAYKNEYRLNNKLEMSKTLNNIGNIYILLGNTQLAIKCYKRSIKFKKQCGYAGGITRTYYTMAQGIFINNKRKIKQAEYYLDKASESLSMVGETELGFMIDNMRGAILMEKKKWSDAARIFRMNITKLKTQPHTIYLATALYDYARCTLRLAKVTTAIRLLRSNLNIVIPLGIQQRIFRTNQELGLAYLLIDNPDNCYKYLSKNLSGLTNATNAEKGHYFFYVALFYKKYGLKTHYAQFLEVSKLYFTANESIKDYYSLKKDFDGLIISDTKLMLDKSKFLILDGIQEYDIH